MIEKNNYRQGAKAMEIGRRKVESFIGRWTGSELRIS